MSREPNPILVEALLAAGDRGLHQREIKSLIGADRPVLDEIYRLRDAGLVIEATSDAHGRLVFRIEGQT